jgi:hypothetical protein
MEHETIQKSILEQFQEIMIIKQQLKSEYEQQNTLHAEITSQLQDLYFQKTFRIQPDDSSFFSKGTNQSKFLQNLPHAQPNDSYKDPSLKIRKLKSQLREYKERAQQAKIYENAILENAQMKKELQDYQKKQDKELCDAKQVLQKAHFFKLDHQIDVLMDYQKSEEKISQIQKELQDARFQIAFLIKKFDGLEFHIPEQQELLLTLQQKAKGYESGILGLPYVLDEVRDLQGVVELRDKQIAELIQQTNVMDRIYNGMISAFGKSMNPNEFIEENEEKICAEEKRRMKISQLELQARIETLKESPPIHNIQIIMSQ